MARQQKQAVKQITGPVRSGKTALGSWQLLLLAGAVALFTFLSFSPALKNNFVNWDDNAYVFENPHLNKPLPKAISYFFGPHYFIGNYIPLTMATYALEYHAAGLRPALYHKVNVLIHLANVLLVFWLIYLLSGKKPLVAALVSLFFGIHPLHVESVVWIAELKDVLYSFFFIAGLIAYYYYSEKRKNILSAENSIAKKNIWLPFVLSLVFFLLSALSKPAALVFPVVLLLLDFYTQRPLKQIWIEKLPFFLVSIVFGVIAIQAQKEGYLLHNYYTIGQKLLFASHSFLNYLVKLFLPINLSIFYPYPPVVNGVLPSAYYFAPAGVILLFYGVYKTLKHSRLIAFGFLFFLVNVLLVLQLISIGDAIMADRYTYIPYIGLFFIAAMGFERLYNSKKHHLKTYRPLAIGTVVALAVTYSYLTHERCKVWKNDDTIATDLLNKFPDDWLALNNKGFILQEQRQYQEAIKLFTKAIEAKPDYVRAYINMINSYLSMNDMESAMHTIDTALKHAPKDFNLLNKKGYFLATQQKYKEAIPLYKKAIQHEKKYMNAYINMAEAYYKLEDYNSAVKILDAGLKQEPDNYILLNNKGYILFVQGNYTQAIPYYKASLEIKPDYGTASVNLADCYRAMSDSAKTKK